MWGKKDTGYLYKAFMVARCPSLPLLLVLALPPLSFAGKVLQRLQRGTLSQFETLNLARGCFG